MATTNNTPKRFLSRVEIASILTSRRYLTDDELSRVDWSEPIRPGHPLHGRHQRPPFEHHPEVARFLDKQGVDHEVFANWLFTSSEPLALTFASTSKLLAFAQVLVDDAANAASHAIARARGISGGL